MTTACVGIIANPASGKDIRRLVAHGSTFDNNEKINIVRRVLIGLAAMGVEQVWYMPDTFGIVPRAAEPISIPTFIQELPMPVLGDASDSFEAARRLADLNVACIISLGGDGTNRMVAKGCAETPLVPISTGTNNVFPRMVEGTIAGIAAGIFAAGKAEAESLVRQPLLEVAIDGEYRDIALIDVVASTLPWIGARALWEPDHIGEVVLSRVTAAEIGMCGLGGVLFPDATGTNCGAHVVFGQGDRVALLPIAPGLVRTLGIVGARLVSPRETVELSPLARTIALDGEREIELTQPSSSVEVRLNPDGPIVVSVEAAIRTGAANDAFLRVAASKSV